MQRKIDGIVAHSAAPSKPRTTTFSEREVNSYLRFRLREQVPEGITEPVITIVGDGRVSGEAIVDLDAVSRSRRSSSMLDPMRWLTGRLPVTATGTLETGGGEGRFVFGSATVGGVPVPRSVLQQVLTHYSRTPENPNGLGLEDAVRAAGADPGDPRPARRSARRAMTSSAVLERPLASLKGVGTRRAQDLAHASLATIEDLLLRFPLRYEDRRAPVPLSALKAGATAAVMATITGAALKRTRRPGFTIFEITLRDDGGTARAVWFNQRFLRDVFRVGQQVALFGKVEETGGGMQLTSPQYELLADDDEGDVDQSSHARIVPIYERIGTLTPRIQRSLVLQALESLPATVFDPLPAAIRGRLGLPDRATALREAHFPASRRRPCVAQPLSQSRSGAPHRRGVLSLPVGCSAATPGTNRGAQGASGHRRRSDSRVGPRHPAVLADTGPARRREDDCRRHAAARTDEPAVAG